VLNIRHAKVTDLDLIMDLHVSLWDHLELSSTRVWKYTDERKKRLQKELETRLRNENTLTILAEINNETIGYAQGVVTHRTEYLPKIIGTVSTLFVKEKFRRKGVGSRLLLQICRFFKDQKVNNVYLRYVVGNVEGEQFWQDLEFEPILVTAGSNLSTMVENLKQKIQSNTSLS
jgi:GNAT superfamily N-acetyltransferase